jgi:nucleoside-diphosphate-sugar epimerase
MSAILRGLADAAGIQVTERLDPARCHPLAVHDLVADMRRITMLGWRPRLSLTRSLADTLEWWRTR